MVGGVYGRGLWGILVDPMDGGRGLWGVLVDPMDGGRGLCAGSMGEMGISYG